MILRTVTVSSKGQISLPADVLRSLDIEKGTQLLLLQRGEQILLLPAARVAQLVDDELTDFHALSASSFEELWDNEADEVWDGA